MNRITPQDIRKGVETVSASPESTWYKVVETLDNGDELCLAIGMGEGFDEDTICAKLGVLAGNSAMSDYVWDFVMPWNLGDGDNDIWDTEVSNPNESDAEWFNENAQEMIRGFEDGTIGTSLLGSSCGKKKSKKKPVKSSFAGFDDFDSFASYAEAHYLPILDKVSEEGYQITRDDARLLAFLHDDLVSLVNNGFDL